jgi:hypothetical protein
MSSWDEEDSMEGSNNMFYCQPQSLGYRGFRSELKQGELGTSFYYNYSRCAVLHLSWSESLSSALKGEGAS